MAGEQRGDFVVEADAFGLVERLGPRSDVDPLFKFVQRHLRRRPCRRFAYRQAARGRLGRFGAGFGFDPHVACGHGAGARSSDRMRLPND